MLANGATVKVPPVTLKHTMDTSVRNKGMARWLKTNHQGRD